ncbi:MAG: DUF3096 domain-containing protein [Thermoplasmata archaeon]|nr:DUF3096 domain-containing protein [Thermoplasmata archaeon]
MFHPAMGGELFALITILFGILIIIFPHLLSWIIGLYLILHGLLLLIRFPRFF